MATEVNLPELGESVTEGTVTRWLKQEGDTVEVDEPLLEVSTDNVATEIPSPVAGTRLEIKANEDDTVEVGAVLAVVGVHLVGDRVGELIGEAQLIYNWEGYPDDVAPLVHAHPTQNEALGEAHLALAGKPLHFHD